MKAIPFSTAILMLATVAVGFPYAVGADAGPSDHAQSPKPIPWDQIGAEAGGKYSGAGIMLHATASGARLRCDFQKIDGEVTETGLHFSSTAPDSGHSTFSLTAASLQRDGATNRMLAATGRVMVNEKVARYEREGLVEEYSVSVDGVRQDFIITEKSAGAGRLRVVARVEGASFGAADDGVRLMLHGSGREIAYSRLKVTDAAGRELAAIMEVESSSQLAIVVDDAGAVYPVRVDPTFSDADWQSLSAVRGTNDYVSAMAVDPSGPYLYVAGNFTQIGSIAATRIARWDGSSWSALGSGLSGAVSALLVSGPDVYVGGSFTLAGGAAASRIAKWNGSSWSALGTGMNAKVSALAAYGPYIVAGGDFLTAGGVAVNRIAMWDGSVWAAIGTGLSASVYTLATAPDGGAPFGQVLYAGGMFTTAGGTSANRIAKWNGAAWSALGTGADAAVNVIAVNGTDLYVGGAFTSPAARIAKWNGSAWSGLGTGMNNAVGALHFLGPDLYAAGGFTTSGGVTTNGVARWNGVSWSALGVGVGVSSPFVSCLAEYGGQIWSGGTFTAAGGIPVSNFALWHLGTSTWSALNGGINGKVYALAWVGSHLYAGGEFTTAGDVSASNIARWDGSSWSALGAGTNNIVYAIASFGTDIYAGGIFTTAGGVLVNGIAKWNGSAWSALAGGLNGTSIGAFALLPVAGNLYVGGVFTSAGGVGANNIARWNGAAFSALGAGTGQAVYTLALNGVDVYAGGAFTTAGGASANYIAKWNGSAWSALGSGMNSVVYALAVQGTDLLAGGVFSTAGGSTAYAIAKWNGAAWSAMGPGFFTSQINAIAVVGAELFVGGINNPCIWYFDTSFSLWMPVASGTNNFVRALASSPSHLYVGGDFSTAGGKVAAYLARLKTQDVPDIVVEGPDMANIADSGSKSFGVIGTGATTSVQFTLLNTGTADLTGLTVTIDGADPSHFSVTQQPAAPVIPGGNTTFTVLFAPTTSGTKNAALHIASNDPDENPFDISLTGTQIGPGDLDPTFNPNAGDSVYAIAVQPNNGALGIGLPDDRAIALGGPFTTLGGQARSYFARINTDGNSHYTTPVPASSTVHGLGVQSGALNIDRIALGGDFTLLGGVARNYCGRVQNTLDSGFNPNVGGGGVRAMALQPDGKILIGGLFTSVGGTARNYIARLNADGTLDTGFNPGANATVATIAVQTDGKIIVGGYFTNIASTARNYLARLNANGTLDTGFNPNPNSIVLCTTLQGDGKIVFGGWFTTVGATARNYLARVSDTGALDAGYNPNAGNFVHTLAAQIDGKIIAGGFFTTVGGTSRNYIARVNADGTLDSGFNPNAGSFVFGVTLQEDGMVLMGGAFTTVGGQTRNRIARVGGSPATQSFNVTSSSRIQWLRGGASPETTNVIFERLNTGTNYDWLPLGTGTRIAGGWEITGLTLPASGSVRARAITTGGQYNASSSLMQAGATYSLLTPQESWRQTWFGSSSNTGNGADTYDYDYDGLVNLIEWGCNLNPTTASTLPATIALAGANIEFIYTRSVAAVNAGTVFTVEWSDTLLAPWSTAGVTQQILSDNGTVQQVKATVPTGGNPRRFVRLSITAP